MFFNVSVSCCYFWNTVCMQLFMTYHLIYEGKPWFIFILTSSHWLTKWSTIMFANILSETPPFPLLLTHPLVEIPFLRGWLLTVTSRQEVLAQTFPFFCKYYKGWHTRQPQNITLTWQTFSNIYNCYTILVIYLFTKWFIICVYKHFSSSFVSIPPETVQKSGHVKLCQRGCCSKKLEDVSHSSWLSTGHMGKSVHTYFTLLLKDSTKVSK